MELAKLVKAAEWAAKGLRWIRCRPIISAVKHRATYSLFQTIHEEVVHPMREFALHPHRVGAHPEDLPRTVIDICTGLRKVMGNVLELDADMLHCCMKVIVRHGDHDQVATLGRSKPWDNREGPRFLWPNDTFRIDENTVWAALFGRQDGKTKWDEVRCFACNDLAKRAEFCCKRESWEQYYRSTLVFPIRLVNNSPSEVRRIVGMLAFDSPKTGSFGTVPDFFDYRGRWAEYHHALRSQTVFQVGATFADSLGVMLTPLYRTLKKEQANVGKLEAQ